MYQQASAARCGRNVRDEHLIEVRIQECAAQSESDGALHLPAQLPGFVICPPAAPSCAVLLQRAQEIRVHTVTPEFITK
jgi:hypothetical protein